MSQVWRDGRSPKVTCTARTVSGNPCKKPPIKGSNVCRTHGGAAPQVRAKAQVRILMSADAAAAKLIEMIHSKKIDDRTKLLAVKDLLDRAHLGGTQSIEVGVTKRSFEDVSADVVMDLFGVDEEGDPLALTAATSIMDADVVEDEDDNERWEREDVARERAAERSRMIDTRRALPPTSDATRTRREQEEAAALAQAGTVPTWVEEQAADHRSYDPEAGLTREQLLLRRGTGDGSPQRRSTPPKRWAARHGQAD